MEVLSSSLLPVASLVWQSRPGTWMLTYIAKATFELQPGISPISTSQEPIHEEDLHWEDDPERSLYAASDLEPLKPRADVVLVGSVFAPDGQPVPSLVARLVVGEVDKAIEVHQDRVVAPDGTVARGPRFARMPISYERAAGGPDTGNPAGIRAGERDAYGRLRLPNLQPAGLLDVTAPGVVIPPVGFGPLPPSWPERRAKLGRHAAGWSPGRLTAGPLPDDLDWSFFNSAPPDQQLAELPGETRLILENLHPHFARFVTMFQPLRLGASLEGRGGTHPLEMRCDTLWIDTDQAIACLTFRGQLILERVEEAGRIVISSDEPPGDRATLAFLPDADPEPEPMSTTYTGFDEEEELEAEDEPGGSASMTVPPPPMPPLPPIPSSAGPDATLAFSRARTALPGRDFPPSVLPFAAAPKPSVPEEPSALAKTGMGLPFLQTGAWAAVVPKGPPPMPAPPAPPLPPAVQVPAPPGAPLSGPPSLPGPPPLPGAALAAPLPGAAAPMPPPPPSAAMQVPPPRPSSQGWATPAPPPVPTPAPAVAVPAAPPVPSRPVAVPPPAPSSAGAARTESAWAGGMGRPDEPVGQSIGQVVAAAAAAPQAGPQDATAGVLGASNAAASRSAVSSLLGGGKRDLDATGGFAAGSRSGARPSSRLDAREVLHLIWYSPEAVPRICRVPVWREILDEKEESAADDDLADAALEKDPIEVEDTRDIFEILARGASQDVDQLGEELAAAVHSGGRFVPPLLLLAGELAFPFDERETLKAAVAVASPLAGADEGLKAAVREARDLLAATDQLTPGATVEGYTNRIRDAFQRARKPGTPDVLEPQIERALLEGRHYQRRQVLGMNAIRALLHTGTGMSGVKPAPTYLPDDLAKKLPLYQKFRARVLVELYMQEDQYEQHPAALKVLAIGRVQVLGDRR